MKELAAATVADNRHGARHTPPQQAFVLDKSWALQPHEKGVSSHCCPSVMSFISC
jgi:hypothetical protein